MAQPERRQLKTALFAAVGNQLRDTGFKLMEAKERFVQDRDGITNIFQLVCLDGKPGLRIQPNVAVRVERVENIFHQTSGFEPRYQKDTPTIGSSVGILQKEDSSACEFLVETLSDVSKVVGAIMQVFQKFALPYYDRFSSLAAIDAELNSNPTERSPHRGMPWFRCSSGIIVAKLVGRRDYDKLAETYTEVMSRVDKGFYLNTFKALLNTLESVDPDRA